ncbi:hypothetical protein CDAR_273131 [Caerostris darwini]|uniref:Uncharacterized protein n=1 Tax=Caerostris darwini TaxID=1538125 RepID=A0AAV4MGY3_9ARAC|nr:hypothetical protein CDAR_273131 [Caerostris darwini]
MDIYIKSNRNWRVLNLIFDTDNSLSANSTIVFSKQNNLSASTEKIKNNKPPKTAGCNQQQNKPPKCHSQQRAFLFGQDIKAGPRNHKKCASGARSYCHADAPVNRPSPRRVSASEKAAATLEENCAIVPHGSQEFGEAERWKGILEPISSFGCFIFY